MSVVENHELKHLVFHRSRRRWREYPFPEIVHTFGFFNSVPANISVYGTDSWIINFVNKSCSLAAWCTVSTADSSFLVGGAISFSDQSGGAFYAILCASFFFLKTRIYSNTKMRKEVLFCLAERGILPAVTHTNISYFGVGLKSCTAPNPE